MNEDPQAWWDNEPVMEGENPKPEAAPAAEEPVQPEIRPRKQSVIRQITSGSLMSKGADAEKVQEEAQAQVQGTLILMHAGWLTKQGHMVANWKKRWVRLVLDSRCSPRKATLSYFKTEDSGAAVGNATRVGEQGSVNLTGATLGMALPQSGFSVTTAPGKTYPFRAVGSDADRDLWVSRIGECISASNTESAGSGAAAAGGLQVCVVNDRCCLLAF
jgi:hypothetical protein